MRSINSKLTPELDLAQRRAAEAVLAWVRRQRRNGWLLAMFLSGLSLAAGLAALGLTFCLLWLTSLILAPMAMMHVSPWVPLTLTAVITVVMLIDSLYSRRDDLSSVTLWLLRETLGIGPRLLVECIRSALRAARISLLDAPTCAAVLAYLAVRRKSVSREELLASFPGLVWSRLKRQLFMFQGVLFLRADSSRVTLTEPLRLRLHQVLGPQAHYQWRTTPEPEPAPAAEPPPPVEPESLSPHEILGVSAFATWAEIKIAYRNRVKECHPDRFAGLDAVSRERAEEWTKNLNAAYDTLAAQAAPRGRAR